MNYEHTMTAVFLSRPNRFLAHALLDGKEVVCHVKNTGRLKELLNPGVPVVIQHHPDAKAAGRKTEYSLIAVASPVLGGSQWVNIDSQAPNRVAAEYLPRLLPGLLRNRQETNRRYLLELLDPELYRASGGSCSGVDEVEAPQRLVEVYLDAFVEAEWAYASDGMACKLKHFIRSDHPGLFMECVLELPVVDLLISGCDDDDRAR